MPRLDRRTALKLVVGGAGALLVPMHVRGAQASPTTELTSGRIRGRHANGVIEFRGVPYGRDTAPPRRFLPPTPPDPWTGVRDCLTFGPVAPQPGRTGVSEDCLHLNVWTPSLTGRRPVLVWFHGGAYSSGTSNEIETEGHRLSQFGDVVVITVNHRLNAFGYLSLSESGELDLADAGNVGMLDLVLALRWVRSHADRLGGNPDNVTVFGHSGGGAKCATLMAMPSAAGLFHRVWTMSGQQVTASRPDTAARHTRMLLDALSLSTDRINVLRTLPMDALIKVSRAPSYLGPVKDGRSLPRDPFDPDAPPQSAHIPMVLGNTRGETRTLIGRGNPALFQLTWDTLLPALEANSPFMGSLDRTQVIAMYRRLYPAYSPADVFFAATTDSRSWRGQVIEADRRAAQQSGAPTWVYQLDWPSPVDGGRWGAHHGLDVPLVFRTITDASSTADGGPAAASVCDVLSQSLLAFARSGNPSTRRVPWTPFDATSRHTLIVDNPSRVVADPRGEERRLFGSVPYVQPGT